MEFIIDSMQESYFDIVAYVHDHGDHKAPRGLQTHDVPGVQIILNDPSRAVPVDTGRALSMQLAAVEALSLIGGFCDPALLVAAAPEMASFMDGGNFHGGYGVRARGQMITMIDRLSEDPQTRQAQVVLWDPMQDALVPDARDYPCTTSIQFLTRFDVGGVYLDCHVHMRSNDVWRGLSLDMFVFTQLQQAVAGFMGWNVGKYFHHTTSLHMYATDFDKIKQLRPAEKDFSLGPLFAKSWHLDPSRHASWLRMTKVVRDHIRIADMNDDFVHRYDFDLDVFDWYHERILAVRSKL